MRKLLTLVSLILIGNLALAQDVSVIAITAPVSGCSLTAAETVTINVKNIGLTDLSAVPFDLSYTINAGAPVTDLAVSFPFFPPNTTVSYSFTVPANLSVPAAYTFTAYSTLATDINTTNDATTGYVVTSTAPSVGGTVSGGTNVCKSVNSGSLTLSGQTGSVVNWEYSSDGGTTWISISNTTTAQSYLNLSVPTQYRAKVQNGVCAVATSTIASMTIDPTSVGGTVSGTATVCSGVNGATMTSGGGRVGNILKWQFSIDGGVTWTDIANVTTTQTYLNLVTTTRYRVQVQSGACSTAFSSAAIITVNPVSVGGTVSGGTTVCSGANAGNMTLAGQTGSITRWEFSTNAGVTWTNIANTTTTQSYLNLVATRYFRAFVTSGGCAGAYSTIDSIVVNPVSVGGTITTAATVCSGANGATLTLGGNTGTVQYWEFSTDGGITYTNIANVTNTQAYLNLVTNTIYRANVKSGACAAINSSTVTITVSPVSVGGTTSINDTVCSGANSGTITLAGQTGSVSNWQSSPDGITWTAIANTTTSQTYLNNVVTKYYQANVTSGACPSALSSIDTITVDVPSVGGTVSASSNVCYGSNGGTLTLSGNTGSVVRWEYSIDGGINWIAIANTTTTYTYLNITQTTIFRAIVQNGSCSVTTSSTAVLTVDPASVGGNISGATTVCGGANSGTLSLYGYVGTVQFWESSIDGGVTWTNVVNTTATLNYLNLVSTTVYRAIVASGVCSNDTSLTATIIVDNPPIAGNLVSNDTVCSGANGGTLNLVGYVGTIINWELSNDGTTWFALSNTTASQSYLNLTATTFYRAFVNSGVCLGAISNIDTITVDPIAVGGTLTGGTTVCDTLNAGTLTLTGSVGQVSSWESSIDGGLTWASIVNNTTSQVYTNLTDTTWFRAIVTSGTCGNDTSTTAVIYVNPKTVGGMVSVSDTVCAGMNNGTLHLTGNVGTILSWASSTDGGFTWNTIANTTDSLVYNNLSMTTIYLANVMSGICSADTSMHATITVNPVSNAGTITGAVAGCESANGGTLIVGGYTGTITDWLSSNDGGITWVSLGNITATQTYLNLPDTTWYEVAVQSGVCSADTSAPISVIVYPKPVAMYTADTVCQSVATTFTNTSTIASGFIQFNQWDFGDGNNSLSLNPTHTYGAAGTFASSLLLTSNFGCLDTAMVSVYVNPNPPNIINTSGPLTFCSNDSVVLSSSIGGYSYMWSNGAVNIDSTISVAIFTSGTTTLMIMDTLTGCMSVNTATTTVIPAPVVSAGSDVDLSLGSNVTLNGTGTGIISWDWFPNTGLNSTTVANPMASPMVTTTYQLIGTDGNGCTDVDSMTITVLTDYNVIISNLMTPNDDGYNDRWIIQNIENYPNTQVTVVNREGQEVFKSSSYDSNWDGTNEKTGKRLPDGTYYYIVKFENDVKLYKGAITILKEGTK